MRPADRLAALAAAAEPLGASFYPNEASFPLPYVAFRLQQVSPPHTLFQSSLPHPLSLSLGYPKP